MKFLRQLFLCRVVSPLRLQWNALPRLLAVVLLFACQLAWSTPVEEGKAWLTKQVNSSGAVAGQATSVALPVQVQSEVAGTLAAVGVTPPRALLQQIPQTAVITTEYLAHYKLAADLQGISGATYVAQLVDTQNEDGGFGATAGYASNPLDTSWALLAMRTSQPSQAAAKKAVAWLLTQQQTNGSWHVAADEDAIVPTALVVQSLHAYRAHSGVNVAQTQARAWLDTQKQSNHGWGTLNQTAQALLALLPGQTDASAYATSVAHLDASQHANGSWQNDPYITAVVLRALWLAGQPVTNPDFARVNGVVLDSVTDQPVSGAQVALQNSTLTVTTDASGSFSFVGLAAGPEKLTITANGYRTLTADLQLQTSQTVDLGALRLSEINGASANSVTVSGVARYGDNGIARNATIRVGNSTIQADAQGAYILNDIPPGAFTLKAVYSDYPEITVQLNAQAGEHIRFDPVFNRPVENKATLVVLVTDHDTGQPINQANVNLNGTQVYTVATGEVNFTRGLQVGENVIQVGRAGYESTVIRLTLPSGQDVTLPVALKPAVTGTIKQTLVKGVVTDAATHLPIVDAVVRVDGISSLTAQTDAQGAYQLSSPPAFGGNRKIIVEKPGYYTHEQVIVISSNRAHHFDIPLQPVVVSGGAASLSVTVGDRSAGTLLPGALVRLSGSNTDAVTTDMNGQARIARLNTGDTQIHISAPGFESVVAAVDVVAGRQYQLPAELAPQASAAIKLYGTVLDANSQLPLPGAQVQLTGTTSQTVTTDNNGHYEFGALADGDWQLSVTLAGYQHVAQPVHINSSTEANIPLTVDHGIGNPTTLEWNVLGMVVDADTLEVIPGANVLLQEVFVGQAVLSESAAFTKSDGVFEFNGLIHDNARVFVSVPGYDSLVVPLSRTGQPFVSLGNLMLKRSYVSALPDLQISMLDRSRLSMDPYTFTANGAVTAELLNNSNYDAGAFDVVLFEDIDLDGQWQPGIDREIKRIRLNSLQQQERKTVELSVDNIQLKFRDAPLYVMVDASHEVIENIDGNNTRRVGVTCAAGGGLQDVGICVDASGSVSAALYQMEMQGAIAALENPNIIPHDGSIRFTLDTAYNRNKPLHPSVVVTPATLPQLLDDLRTKPPRGSASSGAYCTRYLSEYLLTQSPSTRKTIITIGDGYWEAISTAQAMLPETIANGIARIDAIGVGNINRSILEANVWPQPANSPGGGQVTIAYSTGEVAGAIAQAIAASVQSVDLTLGNFRLLDQGRGQPVKLAMRVGNAGAISQASKVEIWQGNNLIGTLAVPRLRSGEWIDLEMETSQIQGTESLRAIVDPEGINAECNLANNSQNIAVTASDNALANIRVQTDRGVYPANTAVNLTGIVGNLGSFTSNFWIALQLFDAQGDLVTDFNTSDLGIVVSGQSAHHDQPWNTERFAAGTYTLRGQVLDQAGNILDSDSTLFSITASGAANQPAAALSLSTDKAAYSPTEHVRIGSMARNLTQNAHIGDARIELSVRAPNNSIAFSQTLDLGQLTAGSIRALDSQQALQDAPLGEYTINATLLGKTTSGSQEARLATASVRYTVVQTPTSGNPGPTTPGNAIPVPVNQPWALALAVLALLLSARRVLHRRFGQSSTIQL